MKTIIILLIVISNWNTLVYANVVPDSTIIYLSKNIFTIYDRNVSEKQNDSIINRRLYEAFEYFQSDRAILSDSEEKSLFDLIYNNSYSLYTDNQECERLNKRVACCWIALALIVGDDRKYTFLNYASLHISRMENSINERLGVMLVEFLLKKCDRLDITSILNQIKQYIKTHQFEFSNQYATDIFQIFGE